MNTQWRKIGFLNLWAIPDWRNYAAYGLHWSIPDRTLILRIEDRKHSGEIRNITLLRMKTAI